MAYRQGYRSPEFAAQSNGNRSLPKGRPPQRRKRRRWPLAVLVILLLALVVTGVVMWLYISNEVGDVIARNTFYRGVYVDGVELHGMTPAEARDTLFARASEGLHDWRVLLTYEDQEWTIDADTMNLRNSLYSAVTDAVTQAFYVGRNVGSTLETYQAIQTLKDAPYYGFTANVQTNMDQVDSLLAGIAEATDRVAQDAQWYFDATRNDPIVITREVYGAALDVQSLRDEILQMLSALRSDSIVLSPEPLAPAVTADIIRNEQIALIGSFTTNISSSSEEGRNANIGVACDRLNATRYAAGETVSFSKVIGDRNAKNGYQMALEISGGEYVYGYGGGICQVSSTLYNAVLQAGLGIVERVNHEMPQRYVDKGADATVSENRIDFRFRNNTGADIYILANMTTGKNKTCTVQIYGRPHPEGYTFKLVHDEPTVIPIPEAVIKKDEKQEYVTYTDETYEYSKGREGYTLRSYRVTYDANGKEVEREDLGLSTYRAEAPVIYQGILQPLTW